MKFSNLFVPTLKETPKDAEVVSHQLMIRAGLIRKSAAGIYSYLPLGLRVIQKFEAIVREEMNKAGAQEVLLPMVVPGKLWKKSARWDQYGRELLRFTDRKNQDFCLGPTHEEVITELIGSHITSYKQLPINVYQIQTKFRDEIRPRFGVMRSREFVMKDAYSFHETPEDLDLTYEAMHKAYVRIFERCQLRFKVVNADSGSIGGSESAEFMVTADTGEDEILETDSGYAANVEAAETVAIPDPEMEVGQPEAINTPGTKTIDALATFLNKSPETLVKTLIYITDDQEPIMILLRGDHTLNEPKLKNVLNGKGVRPAKEAEIVDICGVTPGFLGPLKTQKPCQVLVDHSVPLNGDLTVGANELDTHIVHVQLSRDCGLTERYDLRNAVPGDESPQGGTYKSTRGIEVGHIFKLGDKYSLAMDKTFLNANGKTAPFIMGCYGIGIGRTVAASIEQCHDEKGIVWPTELAPFHVDVIVAKPKDPEHTAIGDQLYKALLDSQWDTILDDRSDISVGVKFKDAELIGFPVQCVIGKITSETGEVELIKRDTGDRVSVKPDQVLSTINSWLIT
ncbi:proline--tRNA ligase [bacterium]|jgi:prolyl-tRNA synthetase|nr:proline--tRNA ligase [bacterium]